MDGSSGLSHQALAGVDQISRIDVKTYEDAVNAGIQDRIANW